jgi:hypothetical protein
MKVLVSFHHGFLLVSRIGDSQKGSCRSTMDLFCPIESKQVEPLLLVRGKPISLVPVSLIRNPCTEAFIAIGDLEVSIFLVEPLELMVAIHPSGAGGFILHFLVSFHHVFLVVCRI